MGVKSDVKIQWSQATDKLTGETHIFPTRERHDLDDSCYCCPTVYYEKKRTIIKHNSKQEAN